MLIRVAARPALDILVAALLAALLPDEPGCQSYMDRYLTIDPLPPTPPLPLTPFSILSMPTSPTRADSGFSVESAMPLKCKTVARLILFVVDCCRRD